MKAICVDLGGSHATVGIVEDQCILNSRDIPLQSLHGLTPALPLFATVARELLAEENVEVQQCAGLIFSFCGLVDYRNGRVISTNQKYGDAISIDLPKWCKEEFGLRFAMENDARMTLLGEWCAGAARDVDDVVMITLGTGIGGAAMMNGRLVRGRHMQGGCLGGHLPVLFNGRQCNCGAIGCAEAEASGWALPLIARDWAGFADSALAKVPTINFRTVFEQADAKDHVATEIRDRCLRIWATVAVGLIHAYDPEKIVIGGGVMGSADIIVPFIQDHVKNHSWTPWGTVRIVAAELKNSAALLGAIPLLTLSYLGDY